MERRMDYGPGRGYGRSFGVGRCMGYGPGAYGPRFHQNMDYYPEDRRFEEEILMEEKAILEERLEEITDQLEG